MALYCFRCASCGDTTTVEAPVGRDFPAPWCRDEMLEMRRDYRAEGVGVQTWELKRDREAGGLSNQAKLFLPDNSEFADESDPDGSKGMRAWRENHEPKSSNKKPFWPGEVEKKVLAGWGGKGTRP